MADSNTDDKAPGMTPPLPHTDPRYLAAMYLASKGVRLGGDDGDQVDAELVLDYLVEYTQELQAWVDRLAKMLAEQQQRAMEAARVTQVTLTPIVVETDPSKQN
jgi:hypothetical protein